MSSPFIAEIKLFSFNFAPKGWAQCNGQLLPINQNQALFSLLGTNFGGDGRVNFGLPDLQGRVPFHAIGGTMALGERGGEINHTLNLGEMPLHAHTLKADAGTAVANNAPAAGNTLGISSGNLSSPPANYTEFFYSTNAGVATWAPQSVGNAGGSQPHDNMSPFLVLNFCIALQGIFPSRN